MLTDWYFCCCIKASPTSTKTFLAILETLENTESDGQILYLAYDELRRTDIWMQVYALPQVLKSLKRTDLPQAIEDVIVKPYFYDLIENLSEELYEKYQKLINAVLDGAEISFIIRSLIEAIQATPRKDSSEIRTPYLDLKEFLLETLVLAIVVTQLEYQLDFAGALEAEIGNETSEIKSLLEDSLDYRYGRLAFRLAIQIYQLTAFEQPDELLSLIKETPFSAIALEPDLLQSFALVWSRDILSELNQDNKQAVKKIINESIELTELRRLTTKRKQKNTKEFDSEEFYVPLRRIGIEPNQYLGKNLPIIYWQSVLWEVASQLDAIASAEELGKFWLPPQEVPENLEIWRSYKNVAEDWKGQLKSLLSVRGERVSISANQGYNLPLEDEHKWLFVSPWISMKRSAQNKRRYPTAEKSENLIRLIVASCVSIGLLQTPDNLYSQEFSKLIAHASDVIDKTYNKFLNTYNYESNDSQENTLLTLPLTGLVLFGKRQIQLVGTGQLESISPESFVEILREQNNADESHIVSGDEKEFLESVFPEVLMSWIADGYTSAIGKKASGRWLNLISEVYSYHKHGKHEFPVNQKAALVMRFLHPQEFRDYAKFDWRKQTNRSWNIHHRSLLLTEPDLPPEEWHKPDWDENNLNLSSLFIRASERFVSLINSSNDLIGSPFQRWRGEWQDCLNQLSKTENLDRFTRLRLVELLAHPHLDLSPVEQKTIVYMLLEYGCTYDLKQMIQYIYFTENSANSIKLKTETRELQETLLLAMHKFLEQHSLSLRQGQNTRSAQDPIATRINLQKVELFQAALSKIIYYSWKDRNKKLSQKLAIIRQHSLSEKCLNTKLRKKEFEVELQGTKKQIIQSDENNLIGDWLIKAAIYDPNRFTATLFYEDFDLAGAENLFEESKSKVQNIIERSSKPFWVLAVLVQVEELENNEYSYTFNCGFPFYIIHQDTEKWDLEPSDYLTLNIWKHQEKHQWCLYTEEKKKPIRRLETRLQVGDIQKRKISDRWKKSLDFKDYLWYADVSRDFQELAKEKIRPIFAQYTDKGQWIPLDRDLNDLILTAFTDANTSHVAVLTFIEETFESFGEKAWRLFRQPGENYLLTRDAFVAEDAQAIEQAIGELDNPHSLLMVVEPAIVDDDIVRLALVKTSIKNAELEKFYPQLKSPFDDRNIQWRQLFSDSDESYVAQKEGKQWYYYLQQDFAPGYPRKVRVEWEEDWRVRQLEIAEFIPIPGQWNLREAFVRVEHIQYNEIKLSPSKWQEFLNKWLYIRQGDRLTIQQAITALSNEDNGFVICLTEENIRVRVEAESLTMQKISPEQRPKIEEPRIGEIFSIRFDEKPLDIQDININDIPSEVRANNSCKGIFILLPKRNEGSLCKILWKTDTQPIPQEITISNLEQLSPRLGSQIIGEQTATGWKFLILTPRISVRALWQKKDLSTKKQELYYLGIPDGENKAIAELKPGQFVFLLQNYKQVGHLAIGDGINFRQGLQRDCHVKNSSKFQNQNWTERRMLYRRAVLQIADQLLIGNCSANTPYGNLAINRVQLYLYMKRDGLFELRREFELQEVRQRKQTSAKRSAEISHEVALQKWEEYCHKPCVLDATLQAGNTKVKLENLKIPTKEKTSWTDVVSLAAHEGVFVMEGRYTRDAKVWLFTENNQEITASLRRVPHCTPIEFRTKILGGVNYDERFELKALKLYYVGAEDSDRIYFNRYSETHHRFEFGYGKTLLVPESQLRFNGKEFKSTQLLICHGDLITHLTFQQEENQDETKDATGCIININRVDLQFSQGRTLFYQRSEYKIVHLLHLKVSGDRVTIESVDGFDETTIKKTNRSFERVKAKLKFKNNESEAQLSNLLRSEDSEKKYVILGRLDEKKYKESRGEEVLFEPVRLSFNPPTSEESPLENLQDNEMVFLQAGEITQTYNDMGLELSPPQELSTNNIGEDMQESILLLRREFSIRQDLLARCYKTELREKSFLEDILLVRLSRDRIGRINPSLMVNPPSRKASVLAHEVNSAGLALASVVESSPQKGVKIELKPGIFVYLESEQIESFPDELTPGTSVRIEIDNITSDKKSYRFRITRAAFGDFRYVPKDDIRPVVVLPKDKLFKDKNVDAWIEGKVYDNQYWQEIWEGFTIGSLPNIEASPASYHPQSSYSWQKPGAKEFVKLMQTSHPKVACLGNDGKYYRIVPLTSHFTVGRLEVSEDSLLVKYVPLGQNVNPSDCSNLSWLELSFADSSVQEIIQRCKTEKWRYHDKFTRTWSGDGFDREQLGDHSVQKGPLFFQNYSNSLRLRYTQSEFLRFGFPVDELIAALGKKPGKRATYTVAGTSDKGGLWIELVPGRIVELPAQLVVWKQGVTEISLANLHWEGFAPGDCVELQVVVTDPVKIEKVALLNWIPGPRKAFGSRSCFLPVVREKCNARGAIALGRGEYTLTLPLADFDPTWEIVELTSDNRLLPVSQPKSGDVVFLGLHAGNIVVLGWENLQPVVDKNEAAAWQNHQLTGDLVRQDEQGFSIIWNRMRELLASLGGALPVTVESFSLTTNQLFFSVRDLRSATWISPHRISMARVVGILPDNCTVLLRRGGGLIKMRIDLLVPGLPESLFGYVAKELKNHQVLIGVRRTKDEKILVGWKDESGDKILVQPLFAVSDENIIELDEPKIGLICRSVDGMALYWLPSTQVAWTTITKPELESIFVSGRGAFKVKIAKNNRYVSIIELPEVSNQFRNLKIGEELTVKVISKSNDKSVGRYLVESFTTKVILECETYDNENLNTNDQNKEILVEVVRRISGKQKSLTVVPSGKKRQALDLPQWMTKAFPKPGEYSQEFANFLQWRQAPSHKPVSHEASNLDKLLCYAYYDAYEAPQSQQDRYPRFQAAVAKSWVKKNYSEPEINLTFGIMAILLLYKNGNRKQSQQLERLRLRKATEVEKFTAECQELAFDMTQNIGRRSLRSLHVEVLYQNWVSMKDNRERTDDLWQRLQQIDRYLSDRENLEKIIGAIRQLCDAVKLRNEDSIKDILPIADGLSAALGEILVFSTLDADAEITKELINIYHTLPLTKSSFKLPLLPSHIDKLSQILNRISANKLDITLLEPLEGAYRSPSHLYEPVDLLYLLKHTEIPQPDTDIDDEETKKIWQRITILREFSAYCQDIQPKLQNLQNILEQLRLQQ
ncbi:hypothetical protein F7734_18100 [Scytonema sp. UIC 10036]|uniref:hypothetical protein n=1 Tax=Scytonema sp. UIC 10036 TaxID=2304196 RepID=UPI0012DA21E7|nr:hypothetical protein [Scytonema sp. UIC 10036]MUG94195.1 hypothetical protein [Scytonema sp. UIC 10036]